MDQLFNSVLRIHPEPSDYIDDRCVHRLLTEDPAGYVNHIRGLLERMADGRARVERPPKQIFSDELTGGDFRVMPCVLRDLERTTKTVKIVGTNVVGELVPDQITVGRAFRLDPDENFITHTFDGCLLSSARTGACATIALGLLASTAEKIVIVGAGRVGYYVGVYAATLPSVRDIVYIDAITARAEATAAAVQDLCNGWLRRVTAAAAPPGDADAVVLATISADPVLEPDDVAAPAVVSLGADIETQRELGSQWAHAADVYTDTMDSMQVGDLRAWELEGVISPDDVLDLAALVSRGPRQSGKERRRIFISTGSALFDNLTIDYLVQRLAAADPVTSSPAVESYAAGLS